MKIKSFLAKPYAAIVAKKVEKFSQNAVEDQQYWMKSLVKRAKTTTFGKEHGFEKIQNYEDFKKAVPIRDYEQLKSYIEQIKQGADNVLWPGKPLYFAKTSGTTSGVKYIPISNESIHNHINTAKYALLNYMSKSGKPDFADGKMIFLSGSPTLERVAGIPTGRLSGIVNHHVPRYLRKNQLPSYTTNCVEDWEEKLAEIVSETKAEDMTLISGIPPWMQMYFDWILETTGKSTIKELFPNLQLIVHGGVNFAPYRDKLLASIGSEIDTIETYPASEGFFAFQDTLQNEGLLLNTNSGIFFEFVPAEKIFNENPPRFNLAEIELDKNYAIIINNNAGLWGYNIGDTVKFVSKEPYRIVVTGRTKHFISAFGEHVIAEEIEQAMKEVTQLQKTDIVEYTVAPQMNGKDGAPFHEWYVACEKPPKNRESFASALDATLRAKNSYYDDLVKGKILQPLRMHWLPPHTFIDYMRSIGKLGGQNKLPRLSNDRKIADQLDEYIGKTQPV